MAAAQCFATAKRWNAIASSFTLATLRASLHHFVSTSGLGHFSGA